MTCKTCRGTGRVERDLRTPAEVAAKLPPLLLKRVICPDCKGSGEVAG